MRNRTTIHQPLEEARTVLMDREGDEFEIKRGTVNTTPKMP